MSMSPIGRDVFNVTLTVTQESILVPKIGFSLWLQFLVLLGLEQKVRPELLLCSAMSTTSPKCGSHRWHLKARAENKANKNTANKMPNYSFETSCSITKVHSR